MKLKRILAVILSALMMASAVSVTAGAADINSTNPYEAKAAKYDEKAYKGNDLGATYTPEATTFKLWSPSASDVKVNLYTTGSDEEAGAKLLKTEQMKYDDTNGIWSVTISGNIKNNYYTYSVTNEGTLREVVDVYAKAAGVNGNRGMVVDLNDTDPTGWSNDKYILYPNQTDISVWEVHVKDFSYSETSGVSEKNRGKYLAFTEKNTTVNGDGNVATCVDYLKDLGITHVQINPFYDYASIDEAGTSTQFNWGYDPKNYNVPEGSYSSNPYDGNTRINETKQMIKALHDAGIGVIMDVVYNHTFGSATSSWFDQTVPDYYYRRNANGKWSNGSGCGNDTASEREMYRKYMIDSVKYWVEEYHIDGFRFDLMGLHDVTTMNEIRSELDKIDPRIVVYGEGWQMTTTFDKGTKAASQANANMISERVAFFNDGIRDGLKGSVFNATEKGYIQGSNSKIAAVKSGTVANISGAGGAWSAKQPSQTVTYASCHDNHTMYDRLVASCKGEEKSMFETRYDDLVQMNKISAALVFASQGIPFILAGEEMARTKLGDHNSYASSPDINKIDWSRLSSYSDLVSFYSGMMDIRKAYAPFRTATRDVFDNNIAINHKVPAGVIALTYENVKDACWNTVAVVTNNNTTAKEAEIITKSGTAPTEWVVLANDQAASLTKLDEVKGSTVLVPAQSALVLVDKASYEASKIESTRGMVQINHINKKNGEVLKKSTSTGTIGNYYTTGKDSSLAKNYDYVSADGPVTGKYTKETQVVNYYYTPFEITAKDVNGDGKVNLKDAFMMQKSIAETIKLTPEQSKLADVNYDGKVTGKDVFMFQKILNGDKFPAIGTVITRYVVKSTGKEIIPSLETTDRVGNKYQTTPKELNYYKLDQTTLPKNDKGIYGISPVTVTYYYEFNAVTATAHVKLKEGQTWIPNLYVWEEGNTTVTGAWPGTPMTIDENGWYTMEFSCGGSYNWIINDGGANQTKDMEKYDGDIWVVMNVDKPSKGDNDCTVYSSNPDL